VGHQVQYNRLAAQQNEALTPQSRDKLFAAKAGEVVVVPERFSVIKINAVRQAPAGEIAGMIEAERQQANLELFQGLQDAVQRAAQKLVKTKTDPARARSALGLDPEEAEGEAEKTK
jgi:hypothetical protein